jgi:membrane associated rhomboid family serine protease
MFFFLPIGLDDQTVNRIPWVTIGIAATCLFAFFGTWVLPTPPDTSAQAKELAEYWLEHPQVEPPESLTSVLSDSFLSRMASERSKHSGTATPEEQATFDSLASAFVAAVDHQPIRRYALVPSRGYAQLGWLTYMFLHFGWLHILGNFLFFYLVGPILEDAWGRWVFSAFYVIGGIAAALAQFLAERHSGIAIVGASGAIAACMGAFMLRFASRRVRMFYFVMLGFRPLTGTFFVRAWLWALLWVGVEILSFVFRGAHGSGVAVLAHIGGFAFGAAFALGLKVTGIERKHLAPSVEKTHEAWTQHPGVERGQGLLAEGDQAGARRAFAGALEAQPLNRDAALGLARLELEAGHLEAGSRTLERALTADMARNDPEAIRVTVEELGAAFAPAALKPAIAYRVAQALDAGGNAALAERTYAACGGGGGTLGAKALLRAAELRIASHTDVKVALRYLDSLGALPGASAEAMERAGELRRSVEGSAVPGGGRALSLDHAPSAPRRPVVRNARLLSIQAAALEIEDEMQRKMTLALREVLAVAVGIIPAPEGGSRNLVLTDLVLNWGSAGQRASVVRFTGGALSLPRLFPGVSPREAFGRFLAQLLEGSGATGVPDKDAMLKGEYARFESAAAFEAGCYGLD